MQGRREGILKGTPWGLTIQPRLGTSLPTMPSGAGFSLSCLQSEWRMTVPGQAGRRGAFAHTTSPGPKAPGCQHSSRECRVKQTEERGTLTVRRLGCPDGEVGERVEEVAEAEGEGEGWEGSEEELVK